MLALGLHWAPYGTQYDLYFSLEDTSDTGSPYVGSTIVAADVWLSKDGGANANATNAPTTTGNGIFKLVLTATEMQATNLAITIYDATATELFRPAFVLIKTKVLVGQLTIDASPIGSNNSGLICKGVGTGTGINTQHNTDNTLLHNLLDVVQLSEPTAAPSSTTTVMKILQLLYRRFYNKVTQTSGTQTVYRDDSSTALATMTCSDDGSTQTKGKAS